MQYKYTAGYYKSHDLDMLIPVQTCCGTSYRARWLIQTAGTEYTSVRMLHICCAVLCAWTLDVQTGACVPTWQVTAQHLHPHANPGRRPPLRKDPDVLRHDLVKPPHLRRVIVAVSFENLRADVTRGELRSRGIFCVIQRGMKNLHRLPFLLLFFPAIDWFIQLLFGHSLSRVEWKDLSFITCGAQKPKIRLWAMFDDSSWSVILFYCDLIKVINNRTIVNSCPS